MPITTSVNQLLAQADSEVRALEVDEVVALVESGEGVLIDIRDVRELARDGAVEGAIHTPRGMLEFWFDPASNYHRKQLADESKTYVLFCAGGRRSALGAKTLQDMGMTNVAHLTGGFAAWKKAGRPVDAAFKIKA